MVWRTNLAVINEHITKCRLRKRCIKRDVKKASIKAYYLYYNIVFDIIYHNNNLYSKFLLDNCLIGASYKSL